MSAPYRMLIAVPAAQRSAANAMAYEITGTPIDQGADTYCVLLSPTGAGDATYYACCTVADDVMVSRMQAALAAGVLPGVVYYRWSRSDYTLLASSSTTAQALIGEVWSEDEQGGWQHALSDAGLQVIPTPITL